MLKSMRLARIECNKSQKEAADEFGVHYQTLAKWERDNSRMPYVMIAKISDVYGISPDEIFFGNQNEYTRYRDKNRFK